MARLPRLRLPEYPLHVVVRGNNRQAIFLSEGDRVFFHRILCEAARRFGMDVHAYVLMPNHVHLLVTGRSTDSVSKAIQSLGRRYVAYFNFLHRRTGTLWEGRFHSSVVDKDRYFFACQRYIEMNPVRAGLCVAASEFRWSSYRFYAEHAADDLVTLHPIHSEYGCRDGLAYRRIFDEGMSAETLEAIRDAVRHGWALGDSAFREGLAALTTRRSARITRVGRPKKS
ncbi:MAG TPA: transposase [Usitatibacter sp.]|nr:transposase [Usitatibacter sp.]